MAQLTHLSSHEGADWQSGRRLLVGQSSYHSELRGPDLGHLNSKVRMPLVKTSRGSSWPYLILQAHPVAREDLHELLNEEFYNPEDSPSAMVKGG